MIDPTTPKENLPIQHGDAVRIKKGTPVTRYSPPHTEPTKTSFTIKVDHLISGYVIYTHDYSPVDPNMRCVEKVVNPVIRWAASGGYWASVDINLVEKVI